MLFFTRSFLCIGAIVVLAEGLRPDRMWSESKDAIQATTQATSDRVAALCRQEPARCLALAATVAGAALPSPERSKRSEPQSAHDRSAKGVARRRPSYGRTGTSPD